MAGAPPHSTESCSHRDWVLNNCLQRPQICTVQYSEVCNYSLHVWAAAEALYPRLPHQGVYILNISIMAENSSEQSGSGCFVGSISPVKKDYEEFTLSPRAQDCDSDSTVQPFSTLGSLPAIPIWNLSSLENRSALTVMAAFG